MRWVRLDSDDDVPPAERMRRAHEAWLNWAMASGVRVPRIPVRPVAEGGFDAEMATAAGRAACERWWYLALAVLPDLPA